MDYKITSEEVETVSALLLDLATELDLHYDDEDMFALAPSFQIIKRVCALLERLDHEVHPSVLNIIARYNRTNQ